MNVIICGAGMVGFSISKQLQSQGHSVTVIDQSSEDIKKDILNSEIIISSSITSACIDAYIRGNSRIAIFLSNDKFNLSPLRNFENIKSFSSAKELKKIISEKNKKEKSSNSKLINIDSSLKNWKSLFLYN